MAEVFEPVAESATDLSELTEQMVQAGIDKIASAPGHLPFSEIIARQAAQRTQFRHDNTIVPLAPVAGQPVEVWATSGEETGVKRAVLFYTTDGSRPTSSSAALELVATRQEWDAHAGYLTRWLVHLPAQFAGTVVRYRIAGWFAHPGVEATGEPDAWAHEGGGFAFHYTGERAFTTFSYTVEENSELRQPAWVQNAVIYQIFLDRFRTDAVDGNFPPEEDPQALHGGTLNGVRAALPYLAELGVTCLWLSPLHRAETYHRYDPLDYFSVDPRLGTIADLKALTDEVHALGMRVLLDFVPSHVSWHHPAFLAAQADRQAPSFDWFYFKQWPDVYGSFLDAVPSMPSFRVESAGARQHIIESAVYWLRECGVDGFRLDHSIGQSMDFWTDFRHATRAVQPASFSIAEAIDTPGSLVHYRGRLDSVLDFHLATALRYTFGARAWDLRKFEQFLSAHEQYMAAGAGRVSFLDNHDINRFLFVAGGRLELLKLAALCQFTLQPVPAIYYGTEVGMSQRINPVGIFGGDAEIRRDMSWRRGDWNLDLLSFYQALIRARTSLPVLALGKRRAVHLDAEQQTYAYLRTSSTGLETVVGDALALFNLGVQAQTLVFPATLLPANTELVVSTGVEPVISRTQHQVEITLAPLSGAIYTLAETQRR
ncbi:MAG TPA: alpha-amylase family glycosyl hydrolase [Ktedonobacteraceae bacterium]